MRLLAALPTLLPGGPPEVPERSPVVPAGARWGPLGPATESSPRTGCCTARSRTPLPCATFGRDERRPHRMRPYAREKVKRHAARIISSAPPLLRRVWLGCGARSRRLAAARGKNSSERLAMLVWAGADASVPISPALIGPNSDKRKIHFLVKLLGGLAQTLIEKKAVK